MGDRCPPSHASVCAQCDRVDHVGAAVCLITFAFRGCDCGLDADRYDLAAVRLQIVYKLYLFRGLTNPFSNSVHVQPLKLV